MYASDVFRLLVRRWYVVLLGILATVGLAVGAFRLVTPDYQLQSSVLLLPPKLSTDAGKNPYLALGGLDTTADIVGRAVMAEGVVRSVVANGGDEDFTVELDPTTSGPLLLVTTTAKSPEQASLTMDLVIDEIPLALGRLQSADNVKKNFRITSSLVARDETPEVVRKAQLRAAILAIAVGLALTLMAASLFDSFARRRRARRAARAAAAAAAAAAAPPCDGAPAAIADDPRPDLAEGGPAGADRARHADVAASPWTDSTPGPKSGKVVASRAALSSDVPG